MHIMSMFGCWWPILDIYMMSKLGLQIGRPAMTQLGLDQYVVQHLTFRLGNLCFYWPEKRSCWNYKKFVQMCLYELTICYLLQTACGKLGTFLLENHCAAAYFCFSVKIFTHNSFPCLPLKTWDHSSIKMMYKMSLSLMLKGSPQWPQHVHDWSSSPGPYVNFLLPLPLPHEQDSVLKQNDVWINICMCVFILRL